MEANTSKAMAAKSRMRARGFRLFRTSSVCSEYHIFSDNSLLSIYKVALQSCGYLLNYLR
jgi:hypothetical protein